MQLNIGGKFIPGYRAGACGEPVCAGAGLIAYTLLLLAALIMAPLTAHGSTDSADGAVVKTIAGDAGKRDGSWARLIGEYIDRSELEKLQGVNRFFNDFRYFPDSRQGGDSWAPLQETLLRQGGDCEDLAIAKYFTLRTLGVPVSRLRIAYVKLKQPARGHMVLLYTPPGSDRAKSLVLDNLSDPVVRLAERGDITPVYSFNHDALWIGSGGKPEVRLETARLDKWHALLAQETNS
ncbi:MAG: transglutaminase-like cysteine peptidase [Candidatus Sedimenticola sp. 6PFRAG5]